jgi:DNA (cytosine-5)-methyltransferase 1
MNKHKFNYNWTLKDAVFTKDKGKVFSCFACGGGSTMGYKLAGFDVIGHNDIDKKMIEVYKENHNPKFSFHESITTFAQRKDLPKELYELDILDGSPPCSSFSMAGNREKDWGKEKKFREGQEMQVLDTLFFDFINLAKELQPKVVVAENVKGLLLGAAKEYVRKIYNAFDEAGYYCQHFLLDASKMGVPQRRERVFFICLRKDLSSKFLHWKDMFTQVPEIEMEFNHPEILFKEIKEKNAIRKNLISSYLKHWENALHTGRAKTEKGNTFGYFYKSLNNLVCSTITSQGSITIEESPELLTKNEIAKIGSFPLDYNYLNTEPQYLIGMSVPPVMTAQIATKIYEQWLSKL